jgi:hypothetical protein
VYLCALRAPPPPARRCEQTQTWGNTRPRTTAPATRSTRAGEAGVASASRSALDGSRSLSTLLQKRSEAEQQADLPDIDAADKENPLAVSEVRIYAACACARLARTPSRAPACLPPPSPPPCVVQAECRSLCARACADTPLPLPLPPAPPRST